MKLTIILCSVIIFLLLIGYLVYDYMRIKTPFEIEQKEIRKSMKNHFGPSFDIREK